MQIVYLSPHPDDVAFSCGGSVAADVAAGHAVTLLTVFSEGADSQVRQAEDRAAAAILGASWLPLELPDALDRPEVRGSLDLFTPLGQRHLGILSEVVARLRQQVPRGAAVRAPLGIGGHIDHRIVNAAARAAREVQEGPLSFYEDLPYALAPYSLARRLHGLGARFADAAAGQGTRAASAVATDRRAESEEIAAYHAYLSGLPLGQRMGVAGLRWLLLRLAARAAVKADAPGHRPGPPPLLRRELREVSAFFDTRLLAIQAYESQWPLFFRSPAALSARLRAFGSEPGAPSPVPGAPSPVPAAPSPVPVYERFFSEVTG